MLLTNYPKKIRHGLEGLVVRLIPEGATGASRELLLGRLAPDDFDEAGFPKSDGLDQVFVPNPDRPDHNPYALAYDCDGRLTYLLVRPSPEHPWVSELVEDRPVLKNRCFPS